MVSDSTNPDLRSVHPPPVMEARRWVSGVQFSAEQPLLDVSQAAPVDPPPEPLRRVLAEAALSEPNAHTYGPVLGLPELRETVATRWSTTYGGQILPGHVAITSGCNQAFCAAALTLCRAGDALLVPCPWYFNHAMWLGMTGVEARPVPCDDSMIPDPEAIRARLDDRVRGVLLVTPNNPTGAEYPADLVLDVFDMARSEGITLIIDETYRDFDSREGPLHDLFRQPDWDDTFVHLYSFSKAYRLTGHRVGAMIASPEFLAESEKFLDTVSICPNQLGQRGALFGLRTLGDWLAGERSKILARRQAFEAGFSSLDGWRLKGCGAYFAFAEHPFEARSDVIARQLVNDQSILTIPGSMFVPPSEADSTDRSGSGDRHIRFAFANIGIPEIDSLFHRLAAFRPDATTG